MFFWFSFVFTLCYFFLTERLHKDLEVAIEEVLQQDALPLMDFDVQEFLGNVDMLSSSLPGKVEENMPDCNLDALDFFVNAEKLAENVHASPEVKVYPGPSISSSSTTSSSITVSSKTTVRKTMEETVMPQLTQEVHASPEVKVCPELLISSSSTDNSSISVSSKTTVRKTISLLPGISDQQDEDDFQESEIKRKFKITRAKELKWLAMFKKHPSNRRRLEETRAGDMQMPFFRCNKRRKRLLNSPDN